MSVHRELRVFRKLPEPEKASLLKWLFRFLIASLPSPEGDQRGWDGGTRGL